MNHNMTSGGMGMQSGGMGGMSNQGSMGGMGHIVTILHLEAWAV